MLFRISKKIPFIVCLIVLFSGATFNSAAQEAQVTATAPTPIENVNAPVSTDTSWWTQAKNKTAKIYNNGELSIMLSGYARHGRNTYTPERIDELNELAWGIGFSNAIRDQKDNEESIYGLVISDSHFKPQFMVGYAYQWMKPLGNRFEAGLGVTGLLFSRTDYFGGIPFPGILPVASIGTRNTKLMAAYIPRISRNKGNGDVLLLFVRIDLN
jgi:palmitoyl transferase